MGGGCLWVEGKCIDPIQPEGQYPSGIVTIGTQIGDATSFLNPIGFDDPLGSEIAPGAKVSHGKFAFFINCLGYDWVPRIRICWDRWRRKG